MRVRHQRCFIQWRILKCLLCRGDQSYKNDSSPTCLNTEWSQDELLTTSSEKNRRKIQEKKQEKKTRVKMMEGDDSLDQFICAKCAAPANQRCTGRKRIIADKKISLYKRKTRQRDKSSEFIPSFFNNLFFSWHFPNIWKTHHWDLASTKRKSIARFSSFTIDKYCV